MKSDTEPRVRLARRRPAGDSHGRQGHRAYLPALPEKPLDVVRSERSIPIPVSYAAQV